VPEFTAEQLDAVRYKRQDACVVAGPGSGKTTVLVERYRSLVVDHEFDVSSILAITFTEKAAANMKAKIADQFRFNPDGLRELDQAWIYTIHGFCARLLKENAIAAGVDPRFTVLDARESEDLQAECINAALDEITLKRRGDVLTLIEMLQVPRIGPDLKSAYDAIRSAGVGIDQVRGMASPYAEVNSAALALRLYEMVQAWPANLSAVQREQRADLIAWVPKLAEADRLPLEDLRLMQKEGPINLRRVPEAHKPPLKALREDDFQLLLTKALDKETAPSRSLILDVLERFEELYLERKLARGVLDFNDLERCAIRLLRDNETVRAEIRKKFRQIMLDEFQDVNEQQNQLIELIRGDDVFFAVGDTNQSIYGFRHARPGIFTGYRDEVLNSGKHSGSLMHNFRSRSEILKFVETMLNSSEGIAPRDLRAGRSFHDKPGPSIEILRVLDQGDDEPEEDDSDREAKWIAYRILDLRATLALTDKAQTRPAEFRDFAVLCRNGESMKPILNEFDRAGIPYVCGRRQSFLVSREGLDIAALLSVIANPRDGVALATVLRSPLAGVSDEALLRARLMGSSVTSGLDRAALDAADSPKLDRFLKDLKRWRADVQTTPLDVLIVRMLSDCGYIWDPASPIGDNVEAFLHLARTKGAGRTLLEFLRELESIEKGLNSESELSDEDQGNCVQVMTAHAAKGLEFPVAIVAALQQGTRRGVASVSFTPEHGLGVRWRDASKKGQHERDALQDSWARANNSLVKTREDEETNRLFYVAMTRAEEHLILSYTVGKRPLQNWAASIDRFFDLPKVTPSAEPTCIAHQGFIVSATVTDADPPALSGSVNERAETPVEVVRRAEPGLNDEAAVNVTSLTVFASCPRKYFLQRYTGWSPGMRGNADVDSDNDADEDEISAADLGSAVHAVLAGKPGPHPKEALELAEVFFRSGLGHRSAAAPRAAREWDFISEIEGIIVRGSVDLWFEENGEIEIVDYKTDSAIRTEEYAPQLALYALALEKAFGKRPTRAWLHFLRHDTVAEVSIDPHALQEVRDLVIRLREAQDRLEFELNEGDHCHSCSFYRQMCPAGLRQNPLDIFAKTLNH